MHLLVQIDQQKIHRHTFSIIILEAEVKDPYHSL